MLTFDASLATTVYAIIGLIAFILFFGFLFLVESYMENDYYIVSMTDPHKKSFRADSWSEALLWIQCALPSDNVIVTDSKGNFVASRYSL